MADNWEHPEFTVAKNEVKEVGDRQLQHFQSPDHENSGIPEELILAHEVTADEHDDVQIEFRIMNNKTLRKIILFLASIFPEPILFHCFKSKRSAIA